MTRSNKLSRRSLLLIGAAAAVSGCAKTQQGLNVVGDRLKGTRPAGSFIDEGSFGNPTMQNTQVMNGEIQVLQDMTAKFQSSVPTTINFAFNSARIDRAAAEILDQQAQFIGSFPELRFSVYGHTDAVGSDSYNASLGERRARAVVRYFAGKGISTSRLDALVSRGEAEPIVATASRERQNRRTVTEVAGFVADHPLVLDGNYAQLTYRNYVTSAAQ